MECMARWTAWIGEEDDGANRAGPSVGDSRRGGSWSVRPKEESTHAGFVGPPREGKRPSGPKAREGNFLF